MPTVQRLQHTSVPMPEDGADRARAFYGDVLGMIEISPPSALAAQTLVWFAAGDDGHEVHLFADHNLDHASVAQHLCLQVDDLKAYREVLAEKGVAVEETTAIANRPRLFVRDPFQNLIELTQVDGAYD